MKGNGESPLGVAGPDMDMFPFNDCSAGARVSPPEGNRSIMEGSWLAAGCRVLALLKESCDS